MVWKIGAMFDVIDRLAGTKRVFVGLYIGLSFLFAAEIDIYFNPIVISFSVDKHKSYRDGNYLYLAGEMNIARKADETLTPEEAELEDRCSFQGVSLKDQAGRKLKYRFMNTAPDRSETEDRKNGEQGWGFWRVAIGVDGAVKAISGQVIHECRWVWPFDTPVFSVADWRRPWDVDWRMQRHVSTWLAQSTLLRGYPVERIKERKVGRP